VQVAPLREELHDEPLHPFIEEEPLHPFIEDEPLHPFIEDDPLHPFVEEAPLHPPNDDVLLPNASAGSLGPMLPHDAAVPGAVPHAFDLKAFHLSDLREPLYAGCDVSMLGLIQRLIALQMKHKASDKHSEDVMSLCHELTKPPHPRSFRQAKTMMEKTCMSNCTQIPACPNDHIVFYNSPFDPDYQYADLDNCPTCGESKLDRDGNPVRIFHHLPLDDHVEATFCLRDVVERFERHDDGGHPHGGDMSKEWRDINDASEWERVVHGDDPTFGTDFRNLVLLSASDGVEFWKGHSTWVFVHGHYP
jgi:hypothetical protein